MNGAAAQRIEDAGDFFSVQMPWTLRKATPHEDGGRRFLFCEATNEALDQQGDEILKGALLSTKDFFLANGNVDLDHVTVTGREGVDNPRIFEIGKPAEVKDWDRSVLVKSEIYQGADAEKANWFWSTLHYTPPMSWFPSIGARAQEAKRVYDPAARLHKRVVLKALWHNLAFSAKPQNLSVPAASTVGYEDYLKAWRLAHETPSCVGDACCDDCLSKALTAGAGTAAGGSDVAQLSGGAALRRQSLDGSRIVRPFDLDDAGARYLRTLGTTACPHTRAITHQKITDHFRTCEGMDDVTAARAARHVVMSTRRRRAH